jgi:hypothetical protein
MVRGQRACRQKETMRCSEHWEVKKRATVRRPSFDGYLDRAGDDPSPAVAMSNQVVSCHSSGFPSFACASARRTRTTKAAVSERGVLLRFRNLCSFNQRALFPLWLKACGRVRTYLNHIIQWCICWNEHRLLVQTFFYEHVPLMLTRGVDLPSDQQQHKCTGTIIAQNLLIVHATTAPADREITTRDQ